MPSTPTRDEADPHDIFVIEPDVVLATRAEQPVAAKAPAAKASQDKAPASLAPDILAPDIMADLLNRPSKGRAAPDISVATPVPPATAVPPVDTAFRATAATADIIASDIKASNPRKTPDAIKVPDDIRLDRAPSSVGRWAKRAAVGFLFALGSVAAAEGWDRYGDTAKQMMADWTPQFALNSSQPAEKPAPENTAAAAQPAAAASPQSAAAASPQPAETPVQAAVADQTASPPALSAIQRAADASATTAAAPPQPAQMQSMSQDIAAMGQQIEALKASIAQLKAGQDQMAQQIAQQASHDSIRNAVARTSEARASETRTSEPRARLSSPRPPVRKPARPAYSPAAFNPPPQPAPPLPPPSAAATPMQGQPQMQVVTEDGDLVVRPPMPVR
ncbi:MAG: hypothetical protein KGL35_12645 [Bradyrhizobium sp.]|nr:hypothetical protein [Bradyrhizobium sp.]